MRIVFVACASTLLLGCSASQQTSSDATALPRRSVYASTGYTRPRYAAELHKAQLVVADIQEQVEQSQAAVQELLDFIGATQPDDASVDKQAVSTDGGTTETNAVHPQGGQK